MKKFNETDRVLVLIYILIALTLVAYILLLYSESIKAE